MEYCDITKEVALKKIDEALALTKRFRGRLEDLDGGDHVSKVDRDPEDLMVASIIVEGILVACTYEEGSK